MWAFSENAQCFVGALLWGFPNIKRVNSLQGRKAIQKKNKKIKK